MTGPVERARPARTHVHQTIMALHSEYRRLPIVRDPVLPGVWWDESTPVDLGGLMGRFERARPPAWQQGPLW